MSLNRKYIVPFLLLSVLASLGLTFPKAAAAQIRPVYDQGALGLAQLLNRLNTTASVLMIGAHPDDEDTALLAYLARGENARTAYLSLTRGDGGQNIIGPELGEALGVIRTEELLQARRLDGAEQFFTRAYDYGFSKTLDEAKQKWDERVVLCDVVRIIRFYQPLVVISVFTGTPIDGHGHHQFAGYISPIAVKAAGDAGQCTDAGPVWAVKKFYVRHRTSGEPTLRINTGKFDPMLGRSYFEIAMQARSQHRSQEQGVLELKGDQFSSLDLVNGPEPKAAKETGIFDGLDASTGAFRISSAVFDNSKSILTKLLGATSQTSDPAESRAKNAELTAAILRAAGVQIDVLSDRETVVAGDTFPVAVRMFTSNEDVKVTDISFNVPNVKTSDFSGSQPSFRREVARFVANYALSVPSNAALTQPFWLLRPREGDLYSIPPNSSANPPFQDPPFMADIALEIGGKRLDIRRPLQYRYADDIRGEIRRDVNIVPQIAVNFDKNLLIHSTASKQTNHDVSVSLTNGANGAISGKVRLNVPNGWKVVPAEADFAMARKGEKVSVRFSVSAPTQTPTGSYEIGAEATANGETFSQSMQAVTYEHIQTHRLYRPAKAQVKVVDLRTVPVKVGYIRGSGDRIPEAIEQLGLTVENIDEPTLAAADLSMYDTIVLGIRAYQVRADLVANNRRLLDFVRNGGTLIVQYQLPQTFAQQKLTPFPAEMGPRVVDENAPVTILQPEHPIFSFPNKITADDFKGWVQERNLYNFSTMDPNYVGLLESHDAGEPENKGGLVVADIGRGKYVYCSYSLFRQLPAGVPGSYRLLANLLSLQKATKKS